MFKSIWKRIKVTTILLALTGMPIAWCVYLFAGIFLAAVSFLAYDAVFGIVNFLFITPENYAATTINQVLHTELPSWHLLVGVGALSDFPHDSSMAATQLHPNFGPLKLIFGGLTWLATVGAFLFWSVKKGELKLPHLPKLFARMYPYSHKPQ